MEPQPGELPQGLEIFINILVFSIPFLVLLVAYVAGKIAEKRHYASIHEREGHWLSIPAITGKHLPDLPAVASADLVVGSVVVSVDHFKRFLSENDEILARRKGLQKTEKLEANGPRGTNPAKAPGR